MAGKVSEEVNVIVVDQRKRLVDALRSDHRPSPVICIHYITIHTDTTLHYITYMYTQHQFGSW